jgi:uncharacterized protein YwgA
MDNTNQRFIDVLFALKTAADYNQTLGRIQLQKYVYLTDTVGLIWEVIAPKNGHETYKHGPFDESINNAVDVLAFRGFVDIVSIKMEEKRVDALYCINKTGIKLFEGIVAEEHFNKKNTLYQQIGIHVNRIGWRKLRELVYAEPTYLQSRASGYGYKFDYLSLFSNESLRILYQFENMLKDGQKISKENMVSLFFKLIE